MFTQWASILATLCKRRKATPLGHTITSFHYSVTSIGELQMSSVPPGSACFPLSAQPCTHHLTFLLNKVMQSKVIRSRLTTAASISRHDSASHSLDEALDERRVWFLSLQLASEKVWRLGYSPFAYITASIQAENERQSSTRTWSLMLNYMFLYLVLVRL